MDGGRRIPLRRNVHRPGRGRRERFGRIQEEWDDYTVAIDEVVDGGDVVVGIGTYSGTYKRTGRFFAARVAHVWRVAGGEIVAFEQFTDTELVNRALRAPSTSTETQPSS
ncbi:nuclear transport factor 2 family protein [Microbacterium paraoxydans]|uniref:nuclear transport factor 2 family protein n=1 Tax=Microbacterium paraoxydans TaxID=199592 RepID=UPI003013B495